jgi:hypothetical protein
VSVEAVPPGIRASAIVDLAGTSVRAAATVFIERVHLASLRRATVKEACLVIRSFEECPI